MLGDSGKLKFYALKHKEKGFYKGTFIAENEEIARELAIKNKVIPEAELDKYDVEDITVVPKDSK